MPTFGGKSETFEMFEDLFQTSLKIHNQLTEDERINYFHSLMRGEEMRYKLLKTLMAQLKKIWGNPGSFSTEERKTSFDGNNKISMNLFSIQQIKS